MSLSLQKNALRILGLTLLVLPLASQAQEKPVDTCASAVELFNDGDVEGALEDARWCVTQLEELKQNKTSSFFHDEIEGYIGGEINSQQTMGLSIVERSYNKANKDIDVSLSGGLSGAASNIFATIAAMGVNATPGKKLRIQRRTGVLNNESGSITLVVSLRSSGNLSFTSSSVSEEELIAFAKAFPIEGLDNAKG